MITPNGWFDWAERHPGPPEKLWSDANAIEAVFFHSAVGTFQGVIDVVMGPASNNRSVTGVVDEDGSFVQFYPVTASPWANGSHEWNRRALGFEFAGGYNGNGHSETEPITPAAVQTAAAILHDLAVFKGVGDDYWQRPTTLKEHREVYPTACPSGRIQWDAIKAALFPQPPARVWLWGDELAGMEKRGRQQFHWNESVEIDAYGSYEGDVGTHWHNQGGLWVQVLP